MSKDNAVHKDKTNVRHHATPMRNVETAAMDVQHVQTTFVQNPFVLLHVQTTAIVQAAPTAPHALQVNVRPVHVPVHAVMMQVVAQVVEAKRNV